MDCKNRKDGRIMIEIILLFGFAMALMLPFYILFALMGMSHRSGQRKKARRIISGKKRASLSTICKIIDSLSLTSYGKQPLKHIPEKDRLLIEKLRAKIMQAE